MFDGRLRSQVDAAVKPIGNSIKKAGISADMLTASGIVMAVAAAVAIGAGALRLGFLLLILTGIPDLLDGAVAKASGKSSLRGAFFDSVSDRVTDGLLFGGIAYYLAASGEAPWVVMLPVAGYVTASVVSYIRAKADALGFDARGGIVERAERFILLAIGLLFEPVLLPVLGLIIVLNAITAGQRFVKVWNQATRQTPALSDRRRRRPRRIERPGGQRLRARATARSRHGGTRNS
ncbi:MAG: CDP-alcohol phosphatidyltransferase family protein [Actinomycetota bacterium]|nr:CDP-alcohol phosphatidyltransferase family protein [Actinomycetota bacterium]